MNSLSYLDLSPHFQYELLHFIFTPHRVLKSLLGPILPLLIASGASSMSSILE